MHAIQPPRPARRLSPAITILIALFVALGGVNAASITSAQPLAPPRDQPERGLVFADLQAAVDPVCRGLFRARKTGVCTHGPDAPPAGRDIRRSVAPGVTVAGAAPLPAALCDGDGVSGARTQALYVHAADRPDRYSLYVALFQQLALQVDQIYMSSAADTNGSRHIRFVHDARCNLVIPDVLVSAIGDDTFDNTIDELRAQGYSRTDRKYLLFVDANIYCGIADIRGDDQPGQNNENNIGPSYARNDAGCWFSDVVAHEHMHTLGGVQLSAPHSSRAYHCVDEYDVMCYSDAPYFPQMRVVCPDEARDELRFDCRHDDYYSAKPPPESYLALHWNTANSSFLIGANPCLDAYEPDSAPAHASALIVGETQKHALCVPGDADWAAFSATARKSYRIETLNLAPGTITWLSLYWHDGVTLIDSDKGSSERPASTLIFTARATGRYYIKVAHADSAAGAPAYAYQLRASIFTPELFR